MRDLKNITDDMLLMAREAGKIQLRHFRSSHLDITTKSNSSDVVTIADKDSERFIKDFIHKRFPSDGIISEESEAENESGEWRWVIDPLDGTTNFSQGIPLFSVSIALEHNGEAVIGVVHAPYLGETFLAIKGGGAFLNGKSLSCSAKTSLAESVLATGVPYDKLENPDNNLPQIARVVPLVRGVRRLGSAALDLSYVGAGFLDGYWELNLNRWDVAAGALIAAEAGAVLKSIREGRRHSVMAAAPGIAPLLLPLLK